MSLKEVVDRDCGGSNALLKLTTHFTEDKALKQRGFGQQPIIRPDVVPFGESSEHELVQEFLAQNPVHLMPTSFRMDSLLQEIQDIEQMYSTPLGDAPLERGRGSVNDQWVQEYQEFTEGEEKQSEWIDEYLDLAPQSKTGELLPASSLWAEEFLDFSEKGAVKDASESTDQTAPLDEVIATVDELLRTVDSSDPKFKNSKFIQFLHGLRDGSIKLEEKPAKEPDLVADKWINEFTEQQQSSGIRVDDEDAWVHEYVETNFSDAEDRSWEEWSREMHAENGLSEQWTEEFKTNQEIDFWENLHRQWEDLAMLDNPAQDWLSQYDKFDTSSQYKNYVFEETNPLIDHPDAFKEGLDRLRKGEISNAVLLFEAAVRKQPDHEEAWQYLGTTQAANEQDLSAISALLRCLELNAGNLTARMALAVSYTNESLQQNACDTLKDWIKANGKYSHLLSADSADPLLSRDTFPKVSSFVNTDYLWQVKDIYLKAVQSSPQQVDPDVQIGLGILLNLSTDYDKAIDCFRAALQLKPEDAMVWNKLGATMSNGGRSEEAVEAFRHALSIIPGYVRTRHNLGLACMNLGADREAMEHFLAALNLQKSSSVSKGTSVAMSNNIWASVRTVLLKLGRSDLFPVCEGKNLEMLNKEFSVNV